MAEILDPEQESRIKVARAGQDFISADRYASDHADAIPASIEMAIEELDVAALEHAKQLVEKHGSIESALVAIRAY